MKTNLSLATNAIDALRDIKPPVPIPNYWLWAITILAIVAAVFLFVWWWRRRTRKKAEVVPAPPVPPHERARQKLQAALEFLDQPQEFCIRVSDAVRGYLEERFGLHAPERTTEEFLNELQFSNELAKEHKVLLADFLERCDLVKFARYEPATAELKELHRAALRLVEETASRAPENSMAPPVAASLAGNQVR